MKKSEKIKCISSIVLTGFSVSVVFHYIKANYLVLPYPYNTFLFNPLDQFNDFLVPLTWLKDFNPYFNDPPSTQLPFLNFVAAVFALLPPARALGFYLGLISILVFLINYYYLKTNDLFNDYICCFILSFLSYPFLFAVDRANFELLLYVFLILFITFLRKNSQKLSAFFIALAISLKGTPVFLVFLFLKEKRYRAIIQVIGFCFLINIGTLFLFKNGFIKNLMFLVKGSNFENPIISKFLGWNNFVQRGPSLFTLLKILINYSGIDYKVNANLVLKAYTVASGVITGFLLVFIFMKNLPLWKVTTLLVFAMLLFPPISAEYKLLQIFIPMLLFINYEKEHQTDRFYCAFFGLLLIPKDYFMLSKIVSDGRTNDISVSIFMNPMFMVCISVLIVFEVYWEKMAERTSIRPIACP